MVLIDYSGLMGEKDKSKLTIDYSGLMDAKTITPVEEEQNDAYVKRVLNAPEIVGDMIGKRSTLWEQYTADTSYGGIGMTFLQNISLPAKMLESGISNPIIEMQKGNINPVDWLVESAKGFGGVKQGEYGDVGRLAGVPETASATLGLGASFAVPIAIIAMSKNLMAVSKFADNKLAKAMRSFFNKVQRHGGALNRVGGKVGAYYDDIGNVAVNKSKYLDEMTDLTTTMKRSIVEMPGGKLRELDDEILELVEKGDINSVHRAKELVDDLINNFYTAKSQTQKLLRGTSKKLGEIIDEATYNVKARQIGEKGARKYVENFQKARKDYSELKNGFAYIKKQVVNPQTGEPTRTGALLRELSDTRELNARAVLKNLNRFGTGSNKLARELTRIESAIKLREFGAGALRYAGHGILIGAVAGKVVGRIRSENEEFLFGGNE